MAIIGWILAIFSGILVLSAIITQLRARAAEKALPAYGKITKVPGGTIHWTEAGQGPTIVCIHGLASNHYDFTYGMMKDLARDHRVIALDRPGCGWSKRDGADRAPLTEQAAMIAAFLTAEGIERPVIVGHSLGGAIAVTLGLEHADQVSALALICPATQNIDKTPDMFKGLVIPSAFMRGLIAHTIAGPAGALTEHKILGQVFAPEKVPEDFMTRGGGALGRRPSAFIAASEDIMAAHAAAAVLAARHGELAVPTGVLFGADDHALAPDLHGRAFAAAVPGATYAKLAGRGHMIPLTAPAECAAFVREVAARRVG
jgi:pimeloyl-ACP methyl ester carboxylesterase